MACEWVNLIEAFHDGELADVQSASLLAHLGECPACSARLAGLRSMSAMIAKAPLPAPGAGAMNRIKAGVRARQELGIRRFTTWLTLAAAAVLAFGIVPWFATRPPANPQVAESAAPWEAVAVSAPVEIRTAPGSGADLVQVAQWMADDLSVDRNHSR